MDKKDNSKIAHQDEAEDKLKLKDQKYALFKIKKQNEEMVYLYCSDVESCKNNGIFEGTDHISISIIACDTESVTDMGFMFSRCSRLEKINFGNKFNTENVKDMMHMFSSCSNLKELNLQKFDTKNVTDMRYMFYNCKILTKLDISTFDTTSVKNMAYMFSECYRLGELDLKSFDTSKVSNMNNMFCECNILVNLELGNNFNTKSKPNIYNMFKGCVKISEVIKNKFSNKNE